MNRTMIPVILMLLLAAACGGTGKDEAARGGEGHGGGQRGMGLGQGEPGASAAVPVQVAPVERRSISRFLETNGTLEAEDEVDIVARTAGPITELLIEEGDVVRAGQLVARIDDREAQNQVAIATVARDEAKLAFERAQTTHETGLVSQEAFDSAQSGLRTAEVQLESAELQLAYTEIRAPFDALVSMRYIRRSQFVTSGTPLFRVSDFDPLWCPIEIPEKDLGRVKVGQKGHVLVEAFSGERFLARVLRIRPTVDAVTGTVTVTLEVEGQSKLRPGMFARVFVETDTRQGVIVIPRGALVLDSIGDIVFVRDVDMAVRREVVLGIREGEVVEVEQGLAEGDSLIVLGQEGLADGTPITVLDDGSSSGERSGPPEGPSEDQIEEMRTRMRERGLSDDEISKRIEQMRQGGGGPPGGPGRGPGGSGFSEGGIPPMMEQRIRDASPEDLDRIKERMKQFGMDDEQIEAIVKRVRGEDGN